MFLLVRLSVLIGLAAALHAADTVWLDSINAVATRRGPAAATDTPPRPSRPPAIAGTTHTRGRFAPVNASLRILLQRGSDRFVANVGLDDASGAAGAVSFQIFADGRRVFHSGTMKRGQPARAVNVDLRGAKKLQLLVADAGGGAAALACWADARFEVSGTPPTPHIIPLEEPYLLTPKPSPSPRLNNPAVYGARPGRPFLYRIPAQGERPMAFSAQDLPAGLRIDPRTGIVTGVTPPRGEHRVTLIAENAHGRARSEFTIVSGDTLALTPTMGWNHWYAHYNRITDAMMREAAAILIRSGMADVGYDYVNIDDCWMNAEPDARRKPDAARIGPFRDTSGRLLANAHFPDMKGLADHLHSLGLKAGLYTSPGPKTCAGFAGSHGFEEQDARLFAQWGYDLLKYDWCSYGTLVSRRPTIDDLQRPYRLMGELLRAQPRDIVFNLCQYGMGDVWRWGAEVGGHSWRTAGDLGFELDRVFEVALKNCEHRDWQRPGAWNDPDYIQIGHIGDARGEGLPAPCDLTPTEQYAFMSLWSLMAAPLFYSGDMTRLDEFTLNVLCNPEVIAVNQDPLGQCARVVPLGEDTFLLVKDLADGSKAVGLCNAGETPVTLTAKWSDLGLAGARPVRDIWRHRNLGSHADSFTTEVRRRGVVMVKMGANASR